MKCSNSWISTPIIAICWKKNMNVLCIDYSFIWFTGWKNLYNKGKREKRTMTDTKHLTKRTLRVKLKRRSLQAPWQKDWLILYLQKSCSPIYIAVVLIPFLPIDFLRLTSDEIGTGNWSFESMGFFASTQLVNYLLTVVPPFLEAMYSLEIMCFQKSCIAKHAAGNSQPFTCPMKTNRKETVWWLFPRNPNMHNNLLYLSSSKWNSFKVASQLQGTASLETQ